MHQMLQRTGRPAGRCRIARARRPAFAGPDRDRPRRRRPAHAARAHAGDAAGPGLGGQPAAAATSAAAARSSAATGGNWDRHAVSTQTILGETAHLRPTPTTGPSWIDRGAGYRSGGRHLHRHGWPQGDERPDARRPLAAADASRRPVFPLRPRAASRDQAAPRRQRDRDGGRVPPSTGAPDEGARDAGRRARRSPAAARPPPAAADGTATLRLDAARRGRRSRPRKARATSRRRASRCRGCAGDAPAPRRSRRRRPRHRGAGRGARPALRERRGLHAQAGAALAARQRRARPVGAASVGQAAADAGVSARSARTSRGSDASAFRPMRCGRGSFFTIGDRADWSYLLPKRLRRGRYVLERHRDRQRRQPQRGDARRADPRR